MEVPEELYGQEFNQREVEVSRLVQREDENPLHWNTRLNVLRTGMVRVVL